MPLGGYRGLQTVGLYSNISTGTVESSIIRIIKIAQY